MNNKVKIFSLFFSVLSRVKVSLIDTVIRLEHLPHDAQTGAALELRIKRMDYFDDVASAERATAAATSQQGDRETLETPAISIKNFQLLGLSLHCEEFPASARTFSRMSEVGSILVVCYGW